MIKSLLLFAVAALVISTTLADWCFICNIRIWGKRRRCTSTEKICGRSCTIEKNHKIHCFFKCLKFCPGEKDTKVVKGHHLPMPVDFNVYDMHGKGEFDMGDLAAVFGDKDTSNPALVETFSRADRDGDGKITVDEFKEAPWIFEGQEGKLTHLTGNFVPPPKALTKLTEGVDDSSSPKDVRELQETDELTDEDIERLRSLLTDEE